jgi:hypothetical protein
MSSCARTAIAAACLLLAVPAQSATPTVVFEHGELAAGSTEDSIHVRSGLLQLELAPGAVLSATSGAEFRIGNASAAAREITVLSGAVRIVQTGGSVVFELAPGRYIFDAERLSVQASIAADLLSGEPAVRELDYRSPVVLADRVMLMQNEALKFETKEFVRSLFSVILQGLRR